MSIQSHIEQLKASLPSSVTLVAVSKFHPVEALQEAYAAGQRIFGESRAQELVAKQRLLPQDIQWHFIGPLQSNKVKEIAPFIAMIHSIDSVKLLQEVDKQAAKWNRVIPVLLEIHVAQEESKHGFSPAECLELLETGCLSGLTHVHVCGIMGMATNTEDEQQIRREFDELHTLFVQLKQLYFATDDAFHVLSMGMSHDYPIAIAAGSTMIRVGTFIFGEREY